MTFKAFDPAMLAPSLSDLDGHVRGFATGSEYRKALIKWGLPERHIFTNGIGAESLDACIATFRGRAGWLILAQDLRAFGTTKRMIAEKSDEIEKAGINILDITHPEDRTFSALTQRAQVAISGFRFVHDKRRARNLGRKGGLARAKNSQDGRDELCPRWLVERIVADTRIPWTKKLEILSPHFSEATLRRHYSGINPKGRKKNG